MGQRNAGRGRAAQRRGDARHDGDRQAGFAQGLDLLAAAAEHERIARLQPHDRLAGAHAAHQLGVDVGLRPACAALALADRTPARRRGARAPRMAGGTRSSCRMASASCSSWAARKRQEIGIARARRRRYGRCPAASCGRRAASSSPSAARRAPASSPASASAPAGPSTRRRQKARRRGRLGDQGVDLGAEGARPDAPRRRSARAAPPRCGRAAAVARVGEAPPVETATTTSSRSTMAGRMKSQSAGRSATLTGTPADLAARWAAASRSASPVAMKAATAPRKSEGWTAGETMRRTVGPGRAREVGPAVGGGALAHHDDAAAGEIEEQRQMLHETATRSSRLRASMAAAWEIDSTHRTASGLRRSLDIADTRVGRILDLACLRTSAMT